MKAVVTGSKGFIGKRLVAELERQGAEVAGIDLGDRVEDLDGKFDVLYNLAWTGKGGALRADYRIQMANVEAGMKYYAEARRLGCAKYVCTGTIGEKMVRLPECAGIRSQNSVYAFSKNYLHDILLALEEPDCRVVWATLGNIFGGSDAGGNIVDYCLREILAGRRADFGPAEQPYDFVYVDDAVRALAGIGMDGKADGGAYYVGMGKPRMLKEFLLAIGRLAGCEQLIGIGRRPDDGTRYRREWFDISQLAEDTGFAPRVGFEDGVKMNIAAVKEAMS